MSEPIAANTLYAEDLSPGVRYDLGAYTVTREEIMEFAHRWDPLPMHVHPAAAAQGYFKDIIASGTHTLCIFQRLAVHGALQRWAIIAARGLRDIRLHRPVRPGMTLRGDLRVESVALVPDRGDRAALTYNGRLSSDGEVLMSMTVETYVRCRTSDIRCRTSDPSHTPGTPPE
ncbi:MaoC/PaaZ C-terminal domain-containing protein [Streptomyces sp. NPDC055078]